MGRPKPVAAEPVHAPARRPSAARKAAPAPKRQAASATRPKPGSKRSPATRTSRVGRISVDRRPWGAVPADPDEPGTLGAELDLRAQLPALEPERESTDWGRSAWFEERFDQVLVNFFYRYWLRVEVEGIENVPCDGGALLVSNHSGALPPDAHLIAKAIKEEHDHPRPLHITVEHFFKGYPGLSAMLPKIGAVAGHPANVHRLLFDERQLVLVFPEGRKGTEKLFKDRYKLRRFGRGGFVQAAMRAKTPIVPVAVIGVEEAAPTFLQIPLMRRLTGLIYFPITPGFPHLGPLGMLAYLPAKVKIRFLPPVTWDEYGDSPESDMALVQTVAHDIRGTIQSEIDLMLEERDSVWFG